MTTDPARRLPPPAFVRRMWSITGRLTLLYVGSTAVLLLLAAGYLYRGVQQSLARSDRAVVTGKLRVMQGLLREQPGQNGVLENEIEHEAAANELLRYYLRVLDSDGRVLIETADMSGLVPVAAFPAPARLSAGVPSITEQTLESGRSYLLLATEVEAGTTGRDRRILQIALDVGHNLEVLAEYRRKLLVVLGSGLVFAAVAGMMVTRTGLRPIRAIARATHRITASNLAERLHPAQWPAELHELATAFDAMRDRLQDSFGRLTEFSADLAHALRNPINILRGETEVALAQERTPQDYQQTLASSMEEYERLSRMIDGLLFIARTDNPGATLERTRFAARNEMEAVREFYEALAGERNVSVACEGEAAVSGDPMLFRRAVSNLLANALKYTPAGGRVLICAQELADGTAVIEVRDSGPGIAPEHQPRLFDRFYQVKKSSDQTTQGAGLGLAIVQSIMRLHQGTATIESMPGQGTTVRLRFPPTVSPVETSTVKR